MDKIGFGRRLQDARKDMRMSGEELGRGLGSAGEDVTRQTVSGWENERHYPTVKQLYLICMKLHKTADDLVFGDIKQAARVSQVTNAVKALTDEERLALMSALLSTPVPDHHVEKHFPSAPKGQRT